MRRALLAAGAAACLIAVPVAGAGGAGVSRAVSTPRASAQYVPGEVIVGFRAQASRVAVVRVHGRVPARVSKRFPALRMELLELSRGISVRDAIRAYQADPAVAFAEPNYLRHPDAPVIPADALFDDLWALNNTGQSHPVTDANGNHTANPHNGTPGADIDAPEAWEVTQGNGTVVAVLDTGVDVTHPDLANQLWMNPDEIAANGLDDDSNGHVDDVNGWDFAEDDATLLDTLPHFPGFDHGTHVAGTIAAELDGADGVVGVCPGCKIMVLKIADSDGGMSIADEIEGINYAKAEGAKIVNMSFGGPDWSNAEREAIRTSGMLAVAAAGNDSLDNDMLLGTDFNFDGTLDFFSPSYPAAYTLTNILTVAASNHNDENAYQTECDLDLGGTKPQCAFTSWGHDSVDVSAPGVDIESTVPGGGFELHDGTSMAAPHVSGIAGLVLSHNGALTVAQVKNAIMHSVNKPTSLKTMYIAPSGNLSEIGPFGRTRTGSFTRTSGRVNAFDALSASTTNATPLNDGNINGAITMSRASVSGTVAWPGDINDVKKRRLYAGRTYRITLVVPAGKDYDLYVWKPGTKEIWQGLSRLRAFRARGGSIDEVVTFKALSTGTYYIHVSAWFFSSGKYTLSIKRL